MLNENMHVGFVGAGKVGCSIGKVLSENNIKVGGYYSRSQSSAIEAAAFTGSEAFCTLRNITDACDVLFITVPDACITDVFKQLCELDIDQKVLVHCSGSLSAEEAFPNAEAFGVYTYSIHPLFPVSSKKGCYEELAKAFYSMEGKGPHLDEWKRIFESFGAHVQIIPGERKKKYHAACAISSNLVCALVQESLELLKDCGFDEDGALRAISPLMSANINHIMDVGPTMAFTGPVERNDAQTIAAHLECLSDDEAASMLYRGASKKLVQMARMRHPNYDYKTIDSILD